MKSLTFRGLCLGLAIAVGSVGVATASGPERENHSHSNSTSTVKEVEMKARLVGSGTQSRASGYLESKVITVTNKATRVSTTNSSLSISVKGLTLASGTAVTFQLDGVTIGTSKVSQGKASLRLSTKSGATVPTLSAGSKVTVQDGVNVDLKGTVGAAVSESEGTEDHGSHH